MRTKKFIEDIKTKLSGIDSNNLSITIDSIHVKFERINNPDYESDRNRFRVNNNRLSDFTPSFIPYVFNVTICISNKSIVSVVQEACLAGVLENIEKHLTPIIKDLANLLKSDITFTKKKLETLKELSESLSKTIDKEG